MLGSRVIDPRELVASFGRGREGFLSKTGFKRLYHLEDGENLASLASRVVLKNKIGSIDLVDHLVVVNSSHELITPGLASEIQDSLGLHSNLSLVTINDACTGFIKGLEVATALVESGRSETLLLVMADSYSRHYSLNDLNVSALFSDGASAFLISSAGGSGDGLASSLFLSPTTRASYSVGNLRGMLAISADNSGDSKSRLVMRGGEVFSFVAAYLPGLISKVRQSLHNQDVGWDRVSWFVHQGSKLVVGHVAELLEGSVENLFRAESYGNVVSSSIPFQIIDEWDSFSSADYVGFIGFGVGMSIEVAVYEVRND